MLVYVAGPLSAPTPALQLRNVETAMEAGRAILAAGHAPLIPHLIHWFDEWHFRTLGVSLDYEQYLAWDFEMLRRCDGLLYLGPSPGADRELQEARRCGMAIWFDIAAISTRH